MQTTVKCQCRFLGRCKFIKKLHAAVYQLEDEYPSITQFDKIIVVQSKKSFWNDQLDGSDNSFMISCGQLKKSSFEHLQWIVARIYFNLEMNNYDGIEDDDECAGDCQNESVTDCDDCRCSSNCCEACREEGREYGAEEDSDADNLTRAINRLESVRKIKYSIEIVDDNNINAYALPEGKIQITSAAVENLSEEELAFLIGHEEAHIDKQHRRQKIDLANQVQNGFEEIAKDGETGGFKKVVSILAIGATAIVAAPLISKACELQADSEAKKRIAEAGYSEEDATKFFERLGSYRGKYFSTHPTPQFRKKILE